MDLEKYIQSDFVDRFGQVYSDELADRFGQVYSDRFGRPIWTSIVRYIWPTELNKFIQTDLANEIDEPRQFKLLSHT